MSHVNHLSLIKAGISEWNHWRSEAPDVRADLSDADLSGLNLSGGDFTGANLSSANLEGADLTRAKLVGADLQFANLQRTSGLRKPALLRARNVLLALYPPEGVQLLGLAPNHNDRLKNRDLSRYQWTGGDFTRANLSGFDLTQVLFEDSTFVAADLSGSKLTRADLRWSNFERCDLTKADLRDALLTYCNMGGARMRLTLMRGADIQLADFANTDVQSADLRGVLFRWRDRDPDLKKSRNYVLVYCSADLSEALRLLPAADRLAAGPSVRTNLLPDGSAPANRNQESDHNQRLYGKSLANYDLRGLTLDGLDLSGWDLSKTQCEQTSFRGAILTGCNVDGANLIDATLDGAQLDRASLKHAVLQRASLVGANLQGAVVSQANLEAAALERADCRSAELAGATLSGVIAFGADFSHADLSDCSLKGADLSRANLTGANLDDADLTEARVVAADLKQCRLRQTTARGADFAGTILVDANIQGADFRGVARLDAEALRQTCNNRLAMYEGPLLNEFGLPVPSEHNERVKTKCLSGLDLSGCDLRGADLRGALLVGTRLDHARLNGVDLENARLVRANLDCASVCGAHLKGADLTAATLRHAVLDGSCADNATLVDVDLRSASLSRTSLRQANVKGAVFRDATLEGADLQDVQGLYSDQLAAANINAAVLPPDLGEFSALKNIEGITISARGLVLIQVLLCGYAAVQVASIKDGDLVANRSILTAPLVDIHTPVMFFGFGCPLILLAVYVWMHFYLQHLWEELSQLPAIFQDSRKLYKKVYPWFLNAFVSAHFPILRNDRPLLTHAQIVCTVVITWWLVPATILLLWAKYLPCHDAIGTLFQLGVLALSIGLAGLLQALAGATLRGERRRPLKLYRPKRPQIQIFAFVAITLVLLTTFSLRSINGCAPGRRSADLWTSIARPCIAADIMGVDISVKNLGWRGAEESLVTGARLIEHNLQGASGARAFLAKASLQRSHLEGADFSGADFRWADLTGAHLEGTRLSGADLRGANLRGASLHGAFLDGAILDGKTDLRGANLNGIHGATPEQLAVAIRDAKTSSQQSAVSDQFSAISHPAKLIADR